jgi:hypothetical protein
VELMDFLEVQLFRADPWNCSTLVADWLIECGYPDFAKDLRDVTDPRECVVVAQEHGGLGRLWEGLFKGSVPWADEPLQPGDIAVVTIGEHEAGAIFTGERWALRLTHGLAFASPALLSISRAWRP